MKNLFKNLAAPVETTQLTCTASEFTDSYIRRCLIKTNFQKCYTFTQSLNECRSAIKFTLTSVSNSVDLSPPLSPLFFLIWRRVWAMFRSVKWLNIKSIKLYITCKSSKYVKVCKSNLILLIRNPYLNLIPLIFCFTWDKIGRLIWHERFG